MIFCYNYHTVLQNNCFLEEGKLYVPSYDLLAEFLMDVLILEVFHIKFIGHI